MQFNGSVTERFGIRCFKPTIAVEYRWRDWGQGTGNHDGSIYKRDQRVVDGRKERDGGETNRGMRDDGKKERDENR